jgi:hypothetical protein
MKLYHCVCYECWEPFRDSNPDAGWCSWCRLTPEQRRRRHLKHVVALTVLLAIAIGLLGLGAQSP